jgi:hypothetical protein
MLLIVSRKMKLHRECIIKINLKIYGLKLGKAKNRLSLQILSKVKVLIPQIIQDQLEIKMSKDLNLSKKKIKLLKQPMDKLKRLMENNQEN